MENFNFIPNCIKCHEYVLDKILNAEKVIFLSAWNLELTYILNKKNNEPLYKTLLNKCNDGVKVFLLTSVTPFAYTANSNKKILKYIKHTNFNIKIIDMEKSNIFFSYIFKVLNKFHHKMSNKHCCDLLFHQRYFNVDNKHCMIGGLDMDDFVCSDLNNNKCNHQTYFWIEYGIVFKPSHNFLKYCIDNFNTGGKSTLYSKYFYGNFYYHNTEYSKMRNLIKNSKECIFIENQWIYSNNNTYNNIFKDIANKIIEKYKLNQPFKVIIITNNNFFDRCNKSLQKKILNKIDCKLYKYVFTNFLHSSLTYIYNYLLKNNISSKEINEIIYVYGCLNNIFIHSKNIIIDHDKMLYGTSNVWDRSYTKKNDIELSIYLKGSNVKNIEKQIFDQYIGNNFNNNIIDRLNNTKNLNRIYLNKSLNLKNNLITIIIIIIIIIIYLLLK